MGLKSGATLLRTVSLTAVSVGSGKVWLFDANGNRVAVMRGNVAFPATATAKASIAWNIEIGRMLVRFDRQLTRQTYSMAGGWERKVMVWERSQASPVRHRKYDRFFTPSRRATWDDAIECMKYQFKNANARLRVKADIWLQWAETVSRNHRRKEVDRGRKNAAESDDRKAGLQMRWHWC